MSVKVMGMVWDAPLPRDEKFVLLAYADHADHDGNNIWPAVATMCHKTGYSTRSIQTITKKLVAKKIMIQVGYGKKGTNRYNINVKALQKLPPAKSAPRKKQRDTPAKSAPKPSFNHQDKSLPKNGKGKATKRDPLLDHPAIIEYREIARLHVPISWRKKVVDAVGGDVEKWKGVVLKWIGLGWKPTNVTGMLDIFEGRNSFPVNGNKKKKTTLDQNIENLKVLDDHN